MLPRGRLAHDTTALRGGRAHQQPQQQQQQPPSCDHSRDNDDGPGPVAVSVGKTLPWDPQGRPERPATLGSFFREEGPTSRSGRRTCSCLLPGSLRSIVVATLRAVRHPRRWRQTHAVGLHHALSALLLLSAVAFLLTSLLLGYLRYDQVHFTVLEDVWQRREVAGERTLSLDLIEALSFPVPLAPPHLDDGDGEGSGSASPRGLFGPKVKQNQFTVHTRTYSEEELLAKHHAMDVVYTFVNGSEVNHAYRRRFLQQCAGRTGGDDDDAMLIAEVAYFKWMQQAAAAAASGASRLSRVDDGQLPRLPLLQREEAGRPRQLGRSSELEWARRTLLAVGFVVDALAAAVSEASANSGDFVTLRLAPPSRAHLAFRRGCRSYRERTATGAPPRARRSQVFLTVRRALAAESVAAVTPFAVWSRFPRHEDALRNATLVRQLNELLLYLPYLEELAARSIAAPSCPPVIAPAAAATTTTNADVLAAIRRLTRDTVDNRDRESDELRYSFRSFEQHVPWHRGRVLLLSPGHAPDWLDHARSFLATRCLDPDTDDGARRRHHHPTSPARALYRLFAQRQRELQEGRPAEAPTSDEAADAVLCFRSAAARDAFTRAAASSPSSSSPTEAAEERPARVRTYLLRSASPTATTEAAANHSVRYLLRTDLNMDRYRLGLREADLALWAEPQHRRPSPPVGDHAAGEGGESVGTRARGKQVARPLRDGDADTRQRPDGFAAAEADRYVYVAEPLPSSSMERTGDARPDADGGRDAVYIHLPRDVYNVCKALDAEASFRGSRPFASSRPAPQPHRRLHVVHQDSVLPYEARLTVNSFTVEMQLFRLKRLTPLHLYVNDDYFFNRELRITKLINSYGGVMVRGDNLLSTPVKAPLGSSDWRAGVDNTFWFIAHANDDGRGDAGGGRGVRSGLDVPEALVDMWSQEGRLSRRRRRRRPGRLVASSSNVTARGAGEVTPYLQVRPPRSQDAYLLAQHMVAACEQGHEQAEYCWTDTVAALLDGTPGECPSAALRSEDAEGPAVHAVYLPERLPRKVLPRHHRRFSMHAPFTYCTNMFRYVAQRYERELALLGFANRHRSSTDLHPPYVHNDLVLKKPWVASPHFLSYAVQLNAFKAAAGAGGGGGVRGNVSCGLATGHQGGAQSPGPSGSSPNPPRPRWARQGRGGEEPIVPPPPPDPVHIALDNDDGCGPATLLVYEKHESLFNKFTDDFAANAERVEAVEQLFPLFFNINTDFTWTNVSAYLRTYLGIKFPFPSFLERRGEEPPDLPHESPFYPDLRQTVLHYAQKRRNATGRGPAEDGPSALPTVSRREHAYMPAGVVPLPVRTTHFSALFERLMRWVPLVLITEDEEAVCPLVRSLQQALPEYRGRRLVLLHIPPATTARRGGSLRTAHVPLAVWRAQARHPVTHFMPVSLCAGLVTAGDGTPSSPLTGAAEAAAGPLRERRGRPQYAERAELPAGTSAVSAIHDILTRSLRQALQEHLNAEALTAPRAKPPQSAPAPWLERFLLEHTAAFIEHEAAPSTASVGRAAAASSSEAAEVMSLIHALVIDSRTGVPRRIADAVRGSSSSSAQGSPSSSRQRRRRRLYDLLTHALSVPGQLLALEDFEVVDLSVDARAEASNNRTDSSLSADRPRGPRAAAPEGNYLSLLKQQMRSAEKYAADNTSTSQRAASLARTVAFSPHVRHSALLLRFTHEEEDEEAYDDADGRASTASYGERSASRDPVSRPPPIHWITGASELDLLSTFPLPSPLWEDEAAPARFSQEVTDA